MENTSTEYLPMRIVKMLVELHFRGYTNLYIWCGMSPSGMNWRYQIGEMIDGKWPAEPHIIHGSLNPESTVEWSALTSTPEELADGFVATFAGKLTRPNIPNAYTRWYANLVNSLGYNELLSFFADYEARHELLLKDAPMFSKTGF